MTDSEYREFWKRSALAFPRIAEFFLMRDFQTKAELSDEEHAMRHALWKSTFLALDVQDCHQALGDMVAGKIPPPGYDPSDFPARIRARVMEFATKRATAIANERLHRGLRGNGERYTLRQDGESVLALAYVSERMGDMRKSSPREIREAVKEFLEEVWPEGEPHPTFPEGWQPGNAKARAAIVRSA